MRDIFLSDLHIGVNASTNLYRPGKHEAALKSVLRYIQNASDIRNVIILGDFLDLVAYTTAAVPKRDLPADREGFLPTVQQIMEANPRIFQEQPDNSGDFVTCIRNISGHFYYVNGNHDFIATPEAITSFLAPHPELKQKVICNPRAYCDGDICGEHGHYYSMVWRPYHNDRYTLGYFLTRGQMDIGNVSPNVSMGTSNKGYSFAEMALATIAYQVKLCKDFTAPYIFPFDYGMPEGWTISSSKVVGKFQDSPDFNMKEFMEHDVEYLETNMVAYAQELFDDGYKIVVLGHSHEETIQQHFPTQQEAAQINDKIVAVPTYINTGFLCGDTPQNPSTFLEICHQEGNAIRTLNVYSIPLNGAPPTLKASCQSGYQYPARTP